MPTLNWIGKEAVVNHHKDVPFHLLKDVPSLSCGDPGSGNLIVQGDNLVALKALLPYYAGQVKCIYIDPPYNTGNEGWVYNDNVNSPEILKWLGKIVGKEAEDLSRHDKWLSMMYPRIIILKEFLKKDGVLIVHIDEHEVSNLTRMLDEIFGRNNQIGQIVWDKGNPKGDAEGVAYQHETILVYAKSKVDFLRNTVLKLEKPNAIRMLNKAKSLFKKIGKASPPEDLVHCVKKYNLPTSILSDYKTTYSLESANSDFREWLSEQKELKGGEKMYQYIHPSGRVYRLVSMAWPNKEKAPVDYFRDVFHPRTKKPCAKPARGWRYPPASMDGLVSQGLIQFGDDETVQPQRVYFLDENLNDNIPSILKFAGSDDDLMAKLELNFPTTKPHEFSEKLIRAFTQKDDIVLDSFAGSGTTGHAVLKLNQSTPDESRKFLLVELEKHIAQEITCKRVRRISEGCKTSKINFEGLGGGFRYCELGDSLFDENGRIRDIVRFPDLARHVYFIETGESLPKSKVNSSPLLGIHHGTGVYLLYNGILGDKSVNGGNILTTETFKKLPTHDGLKIVYGNGCRLGSTRLKHLKLIFKQLPYELKLNLI